MHTRFSTGLAHNIDAIKTENIAQYSLTIYNHIRKHKQSTKHQNQIEI